MRYVRPGAAGLKVSQVCLGMMIFGDTATRKWHLEEEAAAPTVKRAVEAGVTFTTS
jgi:aryl-alcohol dehydrogenase-like predicted oxidoreductase